MPRHIVVKLMGWVHAVRTLGVETVRMTSGYHDEPLEGPRLGQRSIRLSREYRAMYTINTRRGIEFIRVEEVNKHDY